MENITESPWGDAFSVDFTAWGDNFARALAAWAAAAGVFGGEHPRRILAERPGSWADLWSALPKTWAAACDAVTDANDPGPQFAATLSPYELVYGGGRTRVRLEVRGGGEHPRYTVVISGADESPESAAVRVTALKEALGRKA